jgi:hypothetical protein
MPDTSVTAMMMTAQPPAEAHGNAPRHVTKAKAIRSRGHPVSWSSGAPVQKTLADGPALSHHA